MALTDENGAKFPDMDSLFEAEAGAGFDTMAGTDFAPPFLVILQPLSPQLNPHSELYIPQAKQGMIHNTQSLGLYEKVHVVPAKFEFRAVEWKPRNSGGGFVASYDRTSIPDDLTTDPVTGNNLRPNGNLVNQTAYYLVLLEEEKWDKVIIPMTSTQLKKSRRWNSLMAAVKFGEMMDKTVPMFGCKYEMKAIMESNNKGSWWGWQVGSPEILTDPQLFHAGKEANKLVSFLPERVLKAIAQAGSNSSDVM